MKIAKYLLALAFGAAATTASAQYAIDWYKISGGGGASSGGRFSLTGTIGQHDAGGTMSGGHYSLAGGFWGQVSAVQTPGAPTLYISRSGNRVTVFWEAVSGWILAQNANLAAPGGWSASAGVTTADGTNSLTIPAPAGNLFFRLFQP
jgi:hypothetical protein